MNNKELTELKKEEKMTNNLKNENKIEVVARALYGLQEVIDLDYVIKALTSLIEQEKERAVKKDRQAIHRDIVANDNITADEFFEQYLAERKE